MARHCCLATLIFVFASRSLLWGQALQVVPETQPAENRGTLRMAASDDGLHFSDNGKVFARNAAAPGLVKTPNGDLLAVFDDLSRPARPGEPILVVSRSTDDGRTWSAPRPAVVRAQEAKRFRISHGDFALLPNGLVRLYFHVTEPDSKDGSPGKVNFIGSAVTRNGQEYMLDRRMKVGCEPGMDAHPSIARIGSQTLLHVQDREAPTAKSARSASAVLRYTSADGRRFKPTERMRESGIAGNIAALRGGKYGLYVSSGEDLRVMISTDGLRWRAEPGVALRNASDPAVIQLKNSKFLMVYCALPGRGPADSGEPAMVAAPATTGGIAAGAPGVPTGDGTQDATDVQPDAQPGEPGTAPTDGAVAEGPGREPPWDPFSQADPESELGDPAHARADGSDGGEMGSEQAFAPKPDFTNRVDYCQWFMDSMVPPAGSNAYESYASFTDTDRSGPEWQFKDRLSESGDFGPPAPWNPADHPDWEQSYQASQNLLSQFREATLDPRLQFSSAKFSMDSGDADDDRLLFSFLLPSLGSCRTLSKATLAQGWRMENGQVSPDKIRESWEVVLGNANHLQAGPTLIEGLVSVAERSLTEGEARWALKQGVFTTPDQIEAALRTLQAKDSATVEMSRTLRLEHAGAMDAIQYAFFPTDQDGRPRLNVERARKLMNMAGMSDQNTEIPPITADDAQAAVDAFDACYREMTEQWQTGYPAVRSKDIEETARRYADTNVITKAFLPNLSRAYQMQTRSEASRRATQLTYEAALFNARHGRWPTSLDELPDAGRTGARVDPFTGSDFGYQLGADGPTIYSKSENATDDGGVHSKRWADEPVNGSDDFVFWPPQQ